MSDRRRWKAFTPEELVVLIEALETTEGVLARELRSEVQDAFIDYSIHQSPRLQELMAEERRKMGR